MLLLIRSDIGVLVPLLDASPRLWNAIGLLGGRLVLLLHGLPDLLPVDRDGLGRREAEPHRVADDLHDLDDDVVTDHDLLAGTACDDEHGQFLLGKRGGARLRRPDWPEPPRTAARA